MNRKEIMDILPHRDNMLLVDEATQQPNGSAKGSYHVKGDEFFLQGHFPGNPVVPGVILCEMMAQTCCVLLAGQEGVESCTPYFTGLDNVKFRTPVKPGDTFDTTCRITRQKGPFFFAEAEGSVNGKRVASAKFSFSMVKNETPA